MFFPFYKNDRPINFIVNKFDDDLMLFVVFKRSVESFVPRFLEDHGLKGCTDTSPDPGGRTSQDCPLTLKVPK